MELPNVLIDRKLRKNQCNLYNSMLTFSEWTNLKTLAKQADIDISHFNTRELTQGIEVEKEHDGKMGKDVDVVKNKSDLLKIAVAHLREDPKYYTKLKTIEKK